MQHRLTTGFQIDGKNRTIAIRTATGGRAIQITVQADYRGKGRTAIRAIDLASSLGAKGINNRLSTRTRVQRKNRSGEMSAAHVGRAVQQAVYMVQFCERRCTVRTVRLAAKAVKFRFRPAARVERKHRAAVPATVRAATSRRNPVEYPRQLEKSGAGRAGLVVAPGELIINRLGPGRQVNREYRSATLSVALRWVQASCTGCSVQRSVGIGRPVRAGPIPGEARLTER